MTVCRETAACRCNTLSCIRASLPHRAACSSTPLNQSDAVPKIAERVKVHHLERGWVGLVDPLDEGALSRRVWMQVVFVGRRGVPAHEHLPGSPQRSRDFPFVQKGLAPVSSIVHCDHRVIVENRHERTKDCAVDLVDMARVEEDEIKETAVDVLGLQLPRVQLSKPPAREGGPSCRGPLLCLPPSRDILG